MRTNTHTHMFDCMQLGIHGDLVQQHQGPCAQGGLGTCLLQNRGQAAHELLRPKQLQLPHELSPSASRMCAHLARGHSPQQEQHGVQGVGMVAAFPGHPTRGTRVMRVLRCGVLVVEHLQACSADQVKVAGGWAPQGCGALVVEHLQACSADQVKVAGG